MDWNMGELLSRGEDDGRWMNVYGRMGLMEIVRRENLEL